MEKLRRFYQIVDTAARRIETVHAERLQCRRGCAGCCVDGITVFAVEAANIQTNHADLLKNSIPNQSGGCAFLDEEGACRIYESRPYVCRTQGLPLRWLDEIDEEIYELRDICPLNETAEPIEEIDEEDCWTIGEPETTLADLQIEFGGDWERIELRNLFD